MVFDRKRVVGVRTSPANSTVSQVFVKVMDGCRRGMFLVGVFSLALNLLMLTVPLFMTSVYDRVLSSRSEETLLMLTIVAVGALALAGLLESVRQVVLARTGARLETALGGPVLHASLATARTSGADVQGLRDLTQVRQFVSSPLVCTFFDAPVAPLYLALIFIIHPHLGFVTLGAAVVLLLVSVLNQRLTSRPLADAGRSGLVALQKAQAHTRNAEVVRAMGMESNCVASWGEANAKAMIASDAAGRTNAMLTGLTKFLRLLLQITILGYGAYLVLTHNGLSAGIIFAASIISARALAPIDQAVGGWRTFVSATQSWKRLKELLSAAGEEPERMELPAPSASLSVEKLSYAHAAGATPVLRGMQFTVDPGEVVGIIGPSGAGKSTLARLLVGAVRPTAGVVRIGGDDLRHWSPEALGPFLGYLPQDVELFPASVAQNIARMSLAPDAEKIVAAAKLANCHELIQRLPQGYDTILGPGGYGLSGGQRQRIALARAFYGNPRVVVLDEPNASLDTEGEQALIAALKGAREAGMTCVVITQRASVVPALTKLMVLREGRIEDYGPKEEVLQRQMRAQTPAQEPARAPAEQPAAAPAASGGYKVGARFG